MANSELQRAAVAVMAAVQARQVDRTLPLLVAFDGKSGAGKSTLAQVVAAAADAALVQADDFFAAHITDQEWAARSPEERARDALDWRRLRTEALEPLLAGRRARWHPFDFAAGTRPDGSYALAAQAVVCEPKPVIVLDGAYTTRPELIDLVDLSVLVVASSPVRRARLAAREEAAFLAAWHERWGAAEAAYFTYVRPPESFDLVVTLDASPAAERDT